MGKAAGIIERIRGVRSGGPDGPRRFQRLAGNNLGVIAGSDWDKICRDERLDVLERYYDSTQYAHLQPWDEATSSKDDYVPVRQRRPRLNFAFAKVLCSRIASKLVGDKTFPAMTIEEDPDTEEFLKFIMKASSFKAQILEPVRRLLATGSCLVRYYLEDGALKLEWFSTKYCFPVFSGSGELDSVQIRYVFADEEDEDEKGNPKAKWYQLELGRMSDILYDNPPYEVGVEPTFQVLEQVNHVLGFVQAEWFRTSESKHSPDGESLYGDILEFIDEMNYNLSQSSQAVSYNQEPQLTINGLTEEELEELVRSSQKAWQLGKDGKAALLESHMAGTKAAGELRKDVRVGVQDIARIVFLDPDKVVGSAQSAKAMEVMHGPMVELVNELRPWIAKGLQSLLTKMAITVLMSDRAGISVPIVIPPGYEPKSLAIVEVWPPIFPPTMADLKEKAGVALQLTGGSIYSREWAARYLAKDFNVEDVDAELARVAAQPIINPFGAF